MNQLQTELIAQFKDHQGKPSCHFDLPKYLGTADTLYNVDTPTLELIAREFLQRHQDITPTEFFALLDSLAAGKSNEEKVFLAKLLKRRKDFRRQVTPPMVDRWLGTLSGWCQVDSLCQNTLEPEDYLADWGAWKQVLIKLSKDKNINKRRASLVLLCKPVIDSDPRFSTLALENIDRLKGEKDILITKAISWLLRSLVRRHPDVVRKYLETNAPTLPAIAVRETRRKLETGRK